MAIRTKTFHSEDTKEQALAIQILDNCRNELYSQYPYLDGAFAALPICFGEGTAYVDGTTIQVDPAFLIAIYAKDPARVREGYLHMLLHCLYLHILPPFAAETATEMDKKRWDIACDLAVALHNPLLQKRLEKQGKVSVREQISSLLPSWGMHPADSVSPDSFSAEQIYQVLNADVNQKSGVPMEWDQMRDEQKSGVLMEWDQMRDEQKYGAGRNPEQILQAEIWQEYIGFDTHSLWYQRKTEKEEAGIRNTWASLLSHSKDKQGKNRGSDRGFQSDNLDEVRSGKGRFDYSRFLRRFAFIREEVELDMDSFDYIPYDYGIRYYGNLPFVEPLEYKEVHRLEELVIAIDTSSSCSRETVQRFLEETYRILNEKENFFHKFHVYLMQCDCFLQECTAIHTEEEWQDYCRQVTIQGRSGTDFRPVFEKVEELRSRRELRNLKALIYFTDGDGIYPREATDYETAFVFLEKNDHMDKVPDWATILVTNVQGEGQYR